MRYAALIAALMIAATVATAQTIPPIVYDVESDFQQVQALPDQAFVQGAGVALHYRLKSQGRWLTLTGLGARWDARSSSTSTQALQRAATVVTNTIPHYFQILLTSDQTGTAVTNWQHSLIVTYGGKDYPIGIGTLNITNSAWTGAAAILSTVTAQSYTDAAVSNHAAVVATTNSLGHIIVGSGLQVDGDGVLTSAAGAPSWSAVTDKPTTFAPLLTSTQEVIQAGTSAGVTLKSMGGATVATFGAGNTANGAALGNWAVTGNLTVQGTNLITEIGTKVATNDARYLASLTNAAAFATAAQGEKADSAAQPTDAAYTNTAALAAGALPRSGGTMTGDVDMGVYTVTGQRFGNSGVASGATGNDWHAFGNSAGLNASGSDWYAFGGGTGSGALGNSWYAIGQYAGTSTRGDNRLYIDIYQTAPGYSADGATNDTIFLDSDGRLYLGGGTGRAENPSAGVTLRGGARTVGTSTADSFALTDNKQAIPAAVQIGTNATYSLYYSGGLRQPVGFGATNDLTLTFVGPDAGYEAASEFTFTNWRARSVTITTNANTIWHPNTTAPTGTFAQITAKWYTVTNTTKCVLINTSVTGQ